MMAALRGTCPDVFIIVKIRVVTSSMGTCCWMHTELKELGFYTETAQDLFIHMCLFAYIRFLKRGRSAQDVVRFSD